MIVLPVMDAVPPCLSLIPPPEHELQPTMAGRVDALPMTTVLIIVRVALLAIMPPPAVSDVLLLITLSVTVRELE